MEEKNDTRSLKKPPTGTKDLLGIKYEEYEYLVNDFKQYMCLHGFDGVETSILEHVELYAQTVGMTSDIVSKELFGVRSLNDKDASIHTVLRAEGTLSVVRALLNAGRIDEKDLRLYYCGPMFRYSRPQKGRFRQFTQLCCEMVNALGVEYDVEAIYLAHNWLSKHQKSTLRINTLGSLDSRAKYRKALYDFFNFNRDRLKIENQAKLEVNVMRVLDQLTFEEKENMIGILPDMYDFLNDEDKRYFDRTLILLRELKIDYVRDPQLVRGIDYYQQTVFEFSIDGQSVAGGGRYLFNRNRFGENDRQVDGIGWGIGLDRIQNGNSQLKAPPLHVVHVTDYAYGAKICSIISTNGERCLPVYSDFAHCFKLAAKRNAKSIISYSEEDQNSNYLTYKNKTNSKKIKIEHLADCIKQ